MKRATRFALQPGWRLMAQDMGISTAEVLVRSGMPEDLFSRGEVWLTPQEYFGLWQALEATVGADRLPFAIGRAVSAEAFHPAWFAGLCSPNLNVGLQRVADHKRLIGPMAVSVSVGREATEVQVACYGYERPLPSSLAPTEFVLFTQLARMGTREQVRPLSAELVTLPDDPSACETFLGCGLRRGSVNRLRFSAQDAKRPFLTENAELWRVFEPALRQRLSQLEHGVPIRERVRVALLDMLPSGRVSLGDVAARLAMSRRTLQRHLADEAVRFQDVLDDTRRDLAHHYLAQSQISAGEISFLLGFGDANSFVRAFKGWTGSTPGVFRSSARQQTQ